MSWGLALGSGGLRGAAHIGVLKVLEENKLKPKFIAGASSGGVVAAYYAAGFSPEKMENLLVFATKGLKGRKEAEWKVPDFSKNKKMPMGLIDGDFAEKALKTSLSNRDFSRVIIPASIVATDIDTGKTIAFSGNRYNNSYSKATFVTGTKLHEAVRASISIPGLLAPKRIAQRNLIGGGVTDSIPINIVLDMGATRVIAIDLGFSTTDEADSIVKILLKTMELMGSKLAEASVLKADLVICPQTNSAGLLELNKIPDLIKSGEKAAKDNLQLIKAITRE